MKKLLLLIALSVGLLSLSNELYAQRPDKGIEKITPSLLKEYIDFLASDSLKGRKTPGKELDIAADYLASNFKDMGIQPVNGSYFQTIPFSTQDLDVQNTKFRIAGQDFNLKSDYIPFEATEDMNPCTPLNTEIVFVGYGITAPEFNYDDYAGVDVKGKIVFVLKHKPQESDTASIFMGATETNHSLLVSKVRNAKAHGAVGLLLVTDPLNHMMLKPQGYPWMSLSKFGSKDKLAFQVDTRDSSSIAAVQVGEAVVKKLFGSVEALRNIQSGIDKNLKPNSFLIEGSKCELTIKLDIEVVNARNVVGFIKGSDKRLRDEFVIVGGHYDHVGYLTTHKEGEDYIYNGADDNASGAAGVLAVAKAFTASGKTPARSILFILFAGEEIGLIGSDYYCRHPLIPIDKSVAMLNMDMISRNGSDSLQIEGADRNPDLKEIMLKEAEGLGLKYIPTGDEMMGRSDHYNFFKRGITAVDITGGLHKDYHTVFDNPDRVDNDKASRISRLVYKTAKVMANETRRYKVITDVEKKK